MNSRAVFTVKESALMRYTDKFDITFPEDGTSFIVRLDDEDTDLVRRAFALSEGNEGVHVDIDIAPASTSMRGVKLSYNGKEVLHSDCLFRIHTAQLGVYMYMWPMTSAFKNCVWVDITEQWKHHAAYHKHD